MFRRGSATSLEAVLGSIVVPVARVTLIAPALLPLRSREGLAGAPASLSLG